MLDCCLQTKGKWTGVTGPVGVEVCVLLGAQLHIFVKVFQCGGCVFVSASPSACDTSSQKRKLAAVASQRQDVFWDPALQTLAS